MALNKGKTLTGALSWAMSANFIVNAVNVIGMLVFARILGVGVIAQYGLLVVTVELLMLPLNFGFNQAAIKYRGDQSIFSATFALVILQSVGLVTLFAIVKSAAEFVDVNATSLGIAGALMLGIRIIGNFVTLIYAPLESELHYGPIARSKVVATLTAVGSGLAIALTSEPSIYALLARDFLAAALMFGLMLNHCPMRLRPRWESDGLRRVWKFIRPIWLLNILGRGALRIDYALAAFALDQFSFGIYFQIRALVEGVLGFFVNPVQTVVYAFYCGVTNAMALFRGVVSRWTAPAVIVVAVVSSVFFLTDAGLDFVEFILGEEWRSGGALLGGFAIYAVSIMIFEHSKVVALATGIQYTAVIARILQLLIIVLGVVPMISRYGLGGAGVASGAAAAVLALVATGLILMRGLPRDTLGRPGT